MNARTAGRVVNDNAVALSDAERATLSRILGKLGSDFEGERAAAGLLASRFVRSRGLAWDAVLAPVALIEDRCTDQSDFGDWRAIARQLAGLDFAWTQFEAAFLKSLPGFRLISLRQGALLRELVERAGLDP